MTTRPKKFHPTLFAALCGCMCLLALTSNSSAQNSPNAEQLQAMLLDAQNQLKDAQNRKNELATQNQDLQKKLADTDAERQQLKDRVVTLENSGYYFRLHYTAWQEFIDQNPSLRVVWFSYFTSGELMERVTTIIGDGTWPFNVD